MSRIHTYVDAGGAWSEDITASIRIGQTTGGEGGLKGITQVAELGATAEGGLVIDDIESTVGHAGDGILGLQLWTIDEDEAPAGSQRLATCWIVDRRYRNSKVLPELGANVEIDVDLTDLNALFSFRKFAPDDIDAKRPKETCLQRLTAVLASTLGAGLIVDNGLVELPDKGMAAFKYHGASLGDIIGDIAIQAGGLNWFARYNEADDLVELGMYDPNTSTLDTSSMKISNVHADIDDDDPETQTTFAPDGGEELARSPKRTFSRLDVPWDKGTERVVRAGTETTYARRDGTAPNATVRSPAKARELGDAILYRSRNEEDIIRVTVPIRAAHVNDALEGQRIQVKFRQFRGYTGWTWVRILRRTPVPWAGSEAGYDVAYELSPQEAGPSTGAIVQSAFVRGTDHGAVLSLPNPVTPGNHLVAMIGEKAGGGDPGPPNNVDGLPRFGPGAWTRFNGATLTRASEVSVPQHACSAYWKEADSTEQECFFATQNGVIGVWEIAGGDPASATVEYEDLTTDGPDYTIGTGGSPAVGDVALAIWCLGSKGSAVGDWPWDYANSFPWQTPNPSPGIAAGWTIGISKWAGGDGYSLDAFLPGTPWVVIAYALGAGAALNPTVTPGSTSHVFGGISLLIPPA